MTFCPVLDLGPSGSTDDLFAPDLSGHTSTTFDDLPVRKVGKVVRKSVFKPSSVSRAPRIVKPASSAADRTRASWQDSTPTPLTKKNITTPTTTTTTTTTTTPSTTTTTTTTTICGNSAVKPGNSPTPEPARARKSAAKKNKGKSKTNSNTTTTTTTSSTSTSTLSPSVWNVATKENSTKNKNKATTTAVTTRSKPSANKTTSVDNNNNNNNNNNNKNKKKKKKTFESKRPSNSRYRPTMRGLCRGTPRQETIDTVANMDFWAREWEDRKYNDAQSRFPHRRGSRSFHATWSSCRNRRPYQRGTIRYLLKEERSEYVTRPRFY